MNSDKNVPRLLGAAFLFVAIVSLISGVLFASAVGSGSTSDMLVNISHRPALVHVSVLGQLITSSGIIALTALLYAVLNQQNKIMSLIALASWLGEAMFVSLSQIGASALVPLSLDFARAGAPEQSYYQTLGNALYHGVNLEGGTMLMWFYCTGAFLWYYMFYKSNYIPRGISLFGLTVVSVSLVGIVFDFLGYDVPIYVSLPILPFELTIGTWLALRGISNSTPSADKQPDFIAS